jgi:uncharacterized protein YgbK (DUF1537 family)
MPPPTPATLASTQAALGVAEAGALVEHALAAIARGLVNAGTQRLVVAGGETSGAVVQALDVHTLRIGAAICPGVPWTQAVRGAGQGPLEAGAEERQLRRAGVLHRSAGAA